jgi:hypothetical protein
LANGVIAGGGGTLEVSGALGTISALGGAGVLTGSDSASFAGFGSYIVGPKGSWTLAGANSLAAGQSLTDKAKLTITGSLAEAAGATAIFDTTFTENVAFTGSTGKLVLSQSQGYTGTISGFSTSGGTSLDLRDIGFASSGEASWSGGVLTVTDGAHTAHINLAGSFSGSTFTAASDGHGGTLITDPSTALFRQYVATGFQSVGNLETDTFRALPEPLHIQLAGVLR